MIHELTNSWTVYLFYFDATFVSRDDCVWVDATRNLMCTGQLFVCSWVKNNTLTWPPENLMTGWRVYSTVWGQYKNKLCKTWPCATKSVSCENNVNPSYCISQIQTVIIKWKRSSAKTVPSKFYDDRTMMEPVKWLNFDQ